MSRPVTKSPARFLLISLCLAFALLVEVMLLTQTGTDLHAQAVVDEPVHETPRQAQVSSHLLAVTATAKFLYRLVGEAR